MIGKEVVSSKPVAVTEVAGILAERKSAGELGFEQQATLEYAEKFKKLDAEKARALIGELLATEKIKEEAAVKIADILPRTPAELTVIVAKERYTLMPDETAEVLSIVKKYV